MWVSIAAISGCYEDFGDPIRITPEADESITAGPVAVAVDDDVYILYSALFDGRTKMAVRRSSDHGASWDNWYEVDDHICCTSGSHMTLHTDQTYSDYLYATFGYGVPGDDGVHG
jgi:hypothetical protein